MITITNLKKMYDGKIIIPSLSLQIPDKSFTALLGPSGCGKTTLLRMIAGLEKPDGGSIKSDNQILSNETTFLPPQKRGLGMVFQMYAVWPHMTVFENISYPLKIKKLDKSLILNKTQRVISLIKLDGLELRLPHQLSGGQQQRVALARAIVSEPKCILLDEPLSNLDAKLRFEMRKELKELHHKLGITIIHVTHDQREAFELATQIVVLNFGRIEQQGTSQDIQSSPKEGFVKDFLSEK